jgi:hypothetical protein
VPGEPHCDGFESLSIIVAACRNHCTSGVTKRAKTMQNGFVKSAYLLATPKHTKKDFPLTLPSLPCRDPRAKDWRRRSGCDKEEPDSSPSFREQQNPPDGQEDYIFKTRTKEKKKL